MNGGPGADKELDGGAGNDVIYDGTAQEFGRIVFNPPPPRWLKLRAQPITSFANLSIPSIF